MPDAGVRRFRGAVAAELEVSKQAAHQRFKAYAKEVAVEIVLDPRTPVPVLASVWRRGSASRVFSLC